MLKDSLFKYYYFKIRFLFYKQKFNRDPFASKINNQSIEGTVSELIEFVDHKFPIVAIDVNTINGIVNWNRFYENLSINEINQLDDYHMRILVNSDLKYPIIVTSNIDGKISNILDGFHRIKKAYMLKKKTVNAYIIPEIDLKQFKTKCDEKL